jgi:broad specificity phosphatase PhoE
MPDSTTILLVRHGATPANEQQPRILQGGAIDQNLSERGARQAHAVAEFLAEHNITAVYSSYLKRAVETAQEIASRHDLVSHVVDGIQEVNVGQWERLDWASIEARFPNEYKLYHEDASTHGYLGGENHTQVQARILPVFRELAARHVGQTIVVVAHTVVNRTLLATLLGINLNRAKDLPQENCCINVVSCQSDNMQLVTFNSAFHMQS